MPRRIPALLTSAASAAAAGLPDAVRQAGTKRGTPFPTEVRTWSKAVCEAAGKPAVQHDLGENSIDVPQSGQGRIDVVQGSGTLPYTLSDEPGRYRILGAPLTVRCQGVVFCQDGAARREAGVWIATGERIAAHSLRHERGPA